MNKFLYILFLSFIKLVSSNFTHLQLCTSNYHPPIHIFRHKTENLWLVHSNWTLARPCMASIPSKSSKVFTADSQSGH